MFGATLVVFQALHRVLKDDGYLGFSIEEFAADIFRRTAFGISIDSIRSLSTFPEVD